jgi:hypothetical protein
MLQLGILKTWDADTHKAGVQLAGSLTTYLDNIAAATNIAPEAMVLYNYVLVAIPGGNPRDACVVASWPAGSSGGGGGTEASLTFIIDGGGSAITIGQKGHLEIPFACTITQVTILADASGSIVVDIWKDTYANFPPTDADSITAAAPPTISSAQKSQDSTLTGWTTAIAAGDILAFNVDSCATIKRVTISLKVERS